MDQFMNMMMCLLVFTLACVVITVDAQRGVCYTSQARTVGQIRYRQRHVRRYYRRCGWLGWRRCSVDVYDREAYTQHVTVYNRVFQCCHGYALSPGQRCNPLCSPLCQNGGTCVRPNECRCTDDFTGRDCSTKVTINPTPRFGNMLGGTPVYINTLVPTRADEVISCMFGDVEAVMKRINEDMVVCVSPPADREKAVSLRLQIGQRGLLESQFLYKSPENSHGITFLSHDASLILTGGKDVEIYWSPKSIVSSSVEQDLTVDIGIFVQVYNQKTREYSEHQLQLLASNTENDGEERVTLRDNIVSGCLGISRGVKFSICPVLFRIAISEEQSFPTDITIWSGVAFLNSSVSAQFTINQCRTWNKVTFDSLRLGRLPSCPPTESIARSDPSYQIEDMTSLVTRNREYHFTFMRYFHPGVGNCYRQSVPYLDRSGQQCCYGTDGVLTQQPIGGSADRVSPTRNYYEHIIEDLLPFIHCCKEEDSILCPDYFLQRPGGKANGYSLIPPACAVGDPHMVTLDGHKYTFNGKGEFILIQTVSNDFALQGRMEQVNDNRGNPAPGTVFTALVARLKFTNTVLQFEVHKSDRTLRVLRNEVEVSFHYAAKREYDDVVFTDQGNNNVLAWLSNGISIEVAVSSEVISSIFVSLPSSMMRTTSGLMGSFNAIKNDDLLPRNGEEPLPLDDTIENIHYKFGITWMITNSSESLFHYNPGQSWSTFYHPTYTPTFAPTFNNVTLEREAKMKCGGDTFCLFDVAATKRVEIGTATMKGLNTLEMITEMAKPIICDPECDNGVCMKNNTCHCYPGYFGDRCSERVTEECAVNNCLNNATCMRRAMISTCICPPSFTGVFCERKIILPPFKLNVLNGSPRLVGSNVYIEFLVNRPATVQCTLDGIRSDCTHGNVQYHNVTEGAHILKIVATSEDKNITRVTRRFYVGPCAVHLIGDGITVTDDTATVTFVGSANVTSFRCKMDKIVSLCRSPVRYSGLSPGVHRMIVLPLGCTYKTGGKISERFHV